MNKILLINIQKIMLLLTIIFLPIYEMPVRFQVWGIGGRLSYYTILLGLLCFAIEYYVYGVNIDYKMIYFIIIVFFWKVITVLHGLIVFPYYDIVNFSGTEKFMYFLNVLGLHDKNIFSIVAYLAIRSLKNIFMEILTTFFVTVWVFNLYRNNFSRGFRDIRKYALILCIVMCVYAIPEVLLFKFNIGIGIPFLQTINPFLYDVKSHLGWYPPVIWNNDQLRSYCIEPSLFGFLAGFIIPLIWTYFVGNISMYINVFYTYFIMLLFMTKARTSNLIFILDMVLLPLFFYSIRIKKTIILIICLSMLGFGLNFIGNISKNIKDNSMKSDTVTQYYENNIKSMTDKQARSNGSRLINIKSHINVIIKHPFFGTGVGLKDLYVKDNLVPDALKNIEIRGISAEIEKKGILKSSYGNVNNFIYIATNEGIPGLLIYLFPILYVILILYKRHSDIKMFEMSLLIVLIGSIASSMIGEALTTLYITLGVLYIDIFADNSINKDRLQR